MEPGAQFYYHGTVVPGLKEILPASRHGGRVTFPTETSVEHAYATSEPERAGAWADMARLSRQEWTSKGWTGGGTTRVYKVVPMGDVELDPPREEYTNEHRTDFRSRAGWKVVGEIPAD